MAESRLQQLSKLRQSVWIDYLSRRLLREGELEELMREHAVVGVTSNPTIFQKAISEGDAYDEQLREVLAGKDDAKEVFLELAVKDVQDACDLLREVWDGGDGKDGYVSIEVDPNLADDTDATTAEAQRLHELVDRPNCFVKIPATKAGLPAIEEMISRGRNINVTLIFSLQRYAEVVEAYLRGLERLVEAGGDPAKVASVASFFVSRVDTEADRRLDEAGAPDELKGKLAVANAKLAYQSWKELFAGERWEALRSKGATTQRCLWASTSTKNPAYRDVLYVEDLIGPETVNTMPEETIAAFEDHGEVALTLEHDLDEARRVFERVAEAGVDYDDVVAPLEPGPYASARDVIELLDRHGFERAALVGVSLGGRVALEVALAVPERVRALVLVGSGLPGHDWSQELRATWEGEEAALRGGDLDRAVEVSLRTWVDGPRRRPEDVNGEVRARVAEMQRRALELQLPVEEDEEELLVEDVAERLKEVKALTLVLTGEEDQPDILAIADRLAREIPGARRATISNTAHVPSMERSREFDELVLGFLETVR